VDSEELLDFGEADLLEILADELLGEGLGFGPADASGRRRFAEDWLVKKMTAVRQLLCNSKGRSLISGESGDRVVDLATVVDILGSLALGHLVTTILAVIIVKRGADAICGPAEASKP
jgi:hypothetical protein